MSAEAFVATWSRPARRRSIANSLAIGLPLALAAGALGWRLGGIGIAGVAVGSGLALVLVIAALRARHFDRRWLVFALDTSRPDMEDSADLLLRDGTSLNALQRLQQARLRARLESAAAAALRPDWATRRITAASIIGIAIIAAALLWPARDDVLPAGVPAVTRASGPPQLVAQRLRIVPPAYTGLAAIDSNRLDARAPAGSQLLWSFDFAPQPASAGLAVVGGPRIDLVRSGHHWVATRTLNRSILYRVDFSGTASRPPLHRIDAVADTPPVIRIIEPERTLTLMMPGQKQWLLGFEVSDDHGVTPAARLRIIVTKGAGENISFAESVQRMTGSGETRRKIFRASLDITALGLTAGNDIVAQLVVADNRAPVAQIVRSPSLILRRPPDSGEQAGGMDGMVKTVLPAYFRSQRQVIIDAQALQAQRRRLPAATFAARSDSIGVDQRALRLRYGELLGDESSPAPEAPIGTTPEAPTGKTPEAPTSPTPSAPSGKTPETKAPAAPSLEAGHASDDGHDHGAPKAKVFGDPMDVLADYGHAHGESASLLDPESARLLRQAVDAMWQSELNLRQGAPDKALPFAFVALRLVKKIQQAERIYLSRTGPELPPIDLARRLSGDRKGLAAAQPVVASREMTRIDAVPVTVWRALAQPGVSPDDLRLDDIQRWLAANSETLADPLALATAIDAVTRDPGCMRCRETLRGLLWRAIPKPPAQVPRRPAADAIGRRYLDALP